jgi:hypothetical protein
LAVGIIIVRERRRRASRGQTEVVASLLIVCIMLVLTVIAYSWGMPLIEKSESKTRMDYASGFMKKVADNIESVSYDPGSQKTIQGRIMRGRLDLLQEGGKRTCTLIYTLDSGTSFFAIDRWMPQNDPNYYINKSIYGAPDIPGVGIYGLNRPAVLWGMTRSGGNLFRNALKVNGSILYANESEYDYIIYNITCEKPATKTSGLFDVTVLNAGQTMTTLESHNNMTIQLVMSVK